MKRGGKLTCFILKSLILCYSNTLPAQQNSDQTELEQQDAAQISAEFLEFLADWGEINDETFDIIEHHGLLDSEQQQPQEEN